MISYRLHHSWYEVDRNYISGLLGHRLDALDILVVTNRRHLIHPNGIDHLIRYLWDVLGAGNLITGPLERSLLAFDTVGKRLFNGLFLGDGIGDFFL